MCMCMAVCLYVCVVCVCLVCRLDSKDYLFLTAAYDPEPGLAFIRPGNVCVHLSLCGGAFGCV